MNLLSVREYRPGISLLTIDMPGSSANVLTAELFAELDQCFDELLPCANLTGLILFSAKPSIFVAGADLKRIVATLDWPDTEIVKFCEDGRGVMSKLSQMPFPTVAAIHGACVGGGLELALWCDRRVATADRKTILGLPEVQLGLVPGWAGTVRLPRICNLETAIDLVTSGQNISAPAALEAGFVDEVVAQPDSLLDAAAAMVEADSRSRSYLRTRDVLLEPVQRPGKLESLRQKCLRKIRENDDVFPFAPEIVLKHMLSTADKPHLMACASESVAMAKVYGSDPSHGLLNHFFLGEHNRRNPGWVDLKLTARPLAKIGIVGAGLMGTSIAEVCLQRKFDVVLLDASAAAMSAAEKKLSASAQSNKLVLATAYSQLADCDLVIESVVEVAEVKKTVLRQIEEHVNASAVIGTNTSAIPLTKLSTCLTRPENFCGVHFCHPQLMQLVEVVHAAQSSSQTIADVTAWIRSLRKMPVVVRDHAGFVVNRLLAAMLDQSLRLLGWGYPLAQIDIGLRNFGFRGGPFEIVDIIGADTCMYAGREMYDAGIECVTLSPILPRMVKRGWLGRKSGTGFYRYDSPAGAPQPNEELESLLGGYIDADLRPEFDAAQLADSICSVIVLEAARVLDDGVVAHSRDVDLCIINGFAFPKQVGGILFWANRFGLENVNSILRQLAQYDKKLLPSERLNDMQLKGLSFYDTV